MTIIVNEKKSHFSKKIIKKKNDSGNVLKDIITATVGLDPHPRHRHPERFPIRNRVRFFNEGLSGKCGQFVQYLPQIQLAA